MADQRNAAQESHSKDSQILELELNEKQDRISELLRKINSADRLMKRREDEWRSKLEETSNTKRSFSTREHQEGLRPKTEESPHLKRSFSNDNDLERNAKRQRFEQDQETNRETDDWDEETNEDHDSEEGHDDEDDDFRKLDEDDAFEPERDVARNINQGFHHKKSFSVGSHERNPVHSQQNNVP